MAWLAAALAALAVGPRLAISQINCPSYLPYSSKPTPLGWPLVPANWSWLTPECWKDNYIICGGERQTPLDIDLSLSSEACAPQGNPAQDGDIKKRFRWGDADISQVQMSDYLGSAYIQGQFSSLLKTSLNILDPEYVGVQVHVTAPSIHRINGETFPAEMFIVYMKVSEKNLLREGVVMAIPIVEGNSSSLLEFMGFTSEELPLGFEAQSNWRPRGQGRINIGSEIDASLNGPSYLYEGSVPVPPCSETLSWIVLGEPTTATKKQLDNLERMIETHARKPDSPLGGAGRRERFPRQPVGSQVCRAIHVNSLEGIGQDHSNWTCQVLKDAGTWRESAKCWDYVDPCWSKYWSPVDVDTGDSKVSKPSNDSPEIPTEEILHWQPVTGVEVRESLYSLDIEAPTGPSGLPGHFGYLSLRGHIYFAKKISIKVISQHTFNGKRYAGELTIQHLMYGDDFGIDLPGYSEDFHTVAVSIPLELSTQKNAFLQDLSLITLPDLSDGKKHHVDRTVDLARDLKHSLEGDWYWYSSSATHTDSAQGSCKQIGEDGQPTESAGNVRWMIFTTPLPVDIDQLNLLTTSPSVSGVDSSQLTKPIPDKKLWMRNLPAYAVEVNETTCDKAVVIGDWKYGDPNAPWDYANARCWELFYAVCGNGRSQSPIDIPVEDAVVFARDDIFLHRVNWRPIRNLRISNTGHNLQVSNQDFGYVEIMGENGFPQFYEVAQFHLHMPSEHLVGGKQYAAELHVVHKRQKNVAEGADDDLLVVGFLFDVDQNKRSEFLDQIFVRNATVDQDSNLDFHDGYETINTPIDLMQTFGPVLEGDFYRYDGSLTTPPCSEVVKWFVFETALPMSLEQWLGFKEFYPNPNNNRPVQAVHDRTIYKNSFQEGELEKYDFYLGRSNGRDRPKPDANKILLPVFGSVVLALVVMFSTFNRDVYKEKMESAGGLVEADVYVPNGSKMGKSV